MANKEFVIKPIEMKQEMVGLCEDFVKFWREFADTIKAIPADNVDDLLVAWENYFPSHNEPLLKLIKIRLAVEQLAETDKEG